MNTKMYGPLASWTTIAATLVVLGGCASNAPPAAVGSSSQAGTVPQSTTASASTKPAASTSTVQTSTTATKPAAVTVYFDFDSFTVKDQYAAAVRNNAEYLIKSNTAIELDGNADERGSREYNMALGQKRADAVKKALAVLGVKTDRIDTISFGEDKPKASGHDESSWAENRRVDFVLKGK
ncbi:MAG: peptidoglycan-associated lipoprotein Pal [Betaproteobacteria bacterium]